MGSLVKGSTDAKMPPPPYTRAHWNRRTPKQEKRHSSQAGSRLKNHEPKERENKQGIKELQANRSVR